MSLLSKFKDILHAPKTSEGMFDKSGAIILDDTPLVEHLPMTAEGGGSMRQMLEQYFASERYKALSEQIGVESFEEALDFGDQNDDDFPGSPYSLEDERVVFEANARAREVSEAEEAAKLAPPPPPDASSSQQNGPRSRASSKKNESSEDDSDRPNGGS